MLRRTLIRPSENKISRIDDRLAVIEEYLKCIPALGNPASVHSPGYTETYDATTNTHSALASEMLERAVGEIPMAHHTPALANALNSLKGMLTETNDDPKSSEVATRSWTTSSAAHSTGPPSQDEIYSILTGADGMVISPNFGSPLLIP
jgi:hypothetical protein